MYLGAYTHTLMCIHALRCTHIYLCVNTYTYARCDNTSYGQIVKLIVEYKAAVNLTEPYLYICVCVYAGPITLAMTK